MVVGSAQKSNLKPFLSVITTLDLALIININRAYTSSVFAIIMLAQ
jgi:hypothetical protein